ncbi:hypothetical protein BT93_L5211 [Corymbia citriodora subsp. variegata]|uniref:Uncharacterized protein n=1 Tax=Corymbia citriodora subsp. variegata TaxID=360336 RepID=A0A8T0CWQ6_CORYI|nr:hypothetical protein BT93_L5211 [Corymbia citriodora subsp. variegata]
MVEFGDEVVLQSLRIPWLIWIQLLVMFLLILLLYSLISPSSSDDHPCSSSSSAAVAAADAVAPSSSSSSSRLPPPVEPRGSPPSHKHQQFLVRSAHQVSESQSVKGVIATSVSRRVASEEDSMEGENSSHGFMDHHPCSIVRLARMAFLKCLGLDFASENSSFKRHRR